MDRSRLLSGIAFGLGLASAGSAQITISSNITTSTTWTSNNVYALSGDIYVEPGATLTIQAGTVIASLNNSTLAVCRGAQILANGTATSPIIFTSDNDRATWTAGNPETGTYRQLANNEWGNVTIMGAGYISENQVGTNTPAPSASNYADMEGLSPAVTSLNDYGGGNDNDDSGSFSYVSLRYGGRTAAPGVELNGLSLGGLGRNTEVHHIEILNNLDDGIEVWGGTVNLEYLSIWNVGDDSLDLDQGWRGKAQFGLIVQGYSGTGSQGSGFGDNALEIDGAELCNYQPVTTATIYNMTVIGSPHPTNGSTGGDHLTAWRDNANVQIRNSIFMDAGDNVIQNDVSDFENGNTGYGCNGTTTWATRWTTPFTTTSAVNPFANPAAAYTAQTNGNLIDFRDNVFFNNLRAAAYTEANARAVFTGGGGSNNANNAIVTSSPITSVARGAAATPNGSNSTSPVTFLDPTPANDALTAVEFAPNDGFFTAARWRGAFARGNNWLIGWAATARFGLTTNNKSNVPLAGERPGTFGVPVHYTTGNWSTGSSITMTVENLDPTLNVGIHVFGTFPINFPIFGGLLVPNPDVVTVVFGTAGTASFPTFVMPPGLTGASFYTQWAAFDFGVPSGEFTFSNAQSHTVQ
ncbi:MAG: hypothetical protein WAT39_03660 [Planctomycetota bacterium]